MKVTMYWSGGSSYAPADVHESEHAEVFDSIREAREDFAMRASVSATYYPCVDDCGPEDGGPIAWLFLDDGDGHPVVGQEYPDRVLYFGPRGGVRMEAS